MTFNTGNPIGSTDSRDRLDNTENMDYLENSTTELTHADRLGTVRKTRHGMEVEHDAQIAAHESEHDAKMQSFENDFDSRLAGMAFTRVGTFTDGYTLTDMRQTLLWEVSQGGDGHEYGWTGAFPKVVAAGATPATSGGIGAGAWVDRTDVTFRSDLASESGSGLVGYQPVGTGAVATTVQSKLRETVSALDFYANGVSGEKVDPTGVIDSTAGIQAALNTGSVVRLPKGVYLISSPLYMDSGAALIGDGRQKTTILKGTTTAGTGSNAARSGSITDSYAKNAIIICRHADNNFNYGMTIKGLTLKSDGYIVEYGIYAPRMAQWHMEDVYVYQCKYGVVVHTAWLSQFTKVICDSNTMRGLNGKNYGWASGTKGFWWADDGSGSGTGTSLSATNCWARDCHTGWDLYSLVYSVLNGCASDNISSCAYRFSLCHIALNGCGHENVQIDTSYSAAILSEYSHVSFNGCSSYSIFGASSDSTGWLKVSGGRVSLNNSNFADFTTAGTSLNLIVQNGARLTIDNATVPKNGNTYISYSGGSQLVHLSNIPPYIATADGVRYLKGRARDNQLQEKTGKSVLSEGTTIATLTCSGGGSSEYAAVRFKITWYDSAHPSGVGMSNVEVVCYQDASGINYRQAINTSVNIFAGNGYTTAPTYTLTRSDNVWSVVMTPAHGNVTCNTITAEIENIAGFTVALT